MKRIYIKPETETFNMEMENLICLSKKSGSADPDLEVLINEHLNLSEEQDGWLNTDGLW